MIGQQISITALSQTWEKSPFLCVEIRRAQEKFPHPPHIKCFILPPLYLVFNVLITKYQASVGFKTSKVPCRSKKKHHFGWGWCNSMQDVLSLCKLVFERNKSEGSKVFWPDEIRNKAATADNFQSLSSDVMFCLTVQSTKLFGSLWRRLQIFTSGRLWAVILFCHSMKYYLTTSVDYQHLSAFCFDQLMVKWIQL